MRTRFVYALLFSCLIWSTTAAVAQHTASIDVNCEPDTGSTGYAATVAARVTPQNVRNVNSVYSASAMGSTVKFAADVATSTLPGSSSFSYTIPLLNLPGRNGLDVNLTLFYNSRVWTMDQTNYPNTATFNADRDFPSYGFRLGYGYLEYNSSENVYQLTESDGSKKQLVGSGSGYTSTDGSSIYYDPATRILTYKSGTTIHYQPFSLWDANAQAAVNSATLFRPDWIQDTNTNRIQISYVPATATNNWIKGQEISVITDATDRTTNFTYSQVGLDDQSRPIYGLENISGGGKTFRFTWWTNLAFNHDFSSTITQQPSSLPSKINLLRTVTLPNGTSYEFLPVGYDSGRADWGMLTAINQLSSSSTRRSGVSYDYPLSNPSSPLSDYPRFQTETVFDGSRNLHYTHALQIASNGIVTSDTVIDPLGNSTTTNYDSSSGWLRSVVSPSATTSYEYGYGRVFSITTTPTGSSKSFSKQFSYDDYGNITEVREYDYGQSTLGAPTRRTTTQYLYDTTNHILDRPTRIEVYDAQNVRKQLTVTTYTGDSRRNPTKVTQYADPISSTGANDFVPTYDTFGNLTNITGPGIQRSWTYNQCTSAYAGTLSWGNSGQLTASATYDCTKGLISTSTDENSQTAQLFYDSMGRLNRAVRPDSAEFRTTYDDASLIPSITQEIPIAQGKTKKTVTEYDGLGHVVRTRVRDASDSDYSTVDYVYDDAGRLSKQYNPYKPGESSSNYTRYDYDSASRIWHVVAPDGSATTYSYSENTATITDPAGHQRKLYKDALGRTVRADEPGPSQATGTITINGAVGAIQDPDWLPQDCYRSGSHWICPEPTMIYDRGQVTVTVNSYTAAAYYSQGSSVSQLASQLASQLNSSGQPVTAVAIGNQITITATQAGSAGNSIAISGSAQSDDLWNFPAGSFDVGRSGSTLSGGVDSTIASPFITSYSYDPSDRLLTVSQGVQQRTYTYDGLGRLLSSVIPEAGNRTTTYSYPTPTQVVRRDPRGVTKTEDYSNDGLRRLTTVTYSDGTPTVSFTYDTAPFGKGAIASASNATATETYEYDQLGQTKKKTYTIAGVQYPVTYGFNLDGSTNAITYPSNHTVTYTPNAVGWVSTVSGDRTYLTVSSPANGAYNAAGQPWGYFYGNGVQAKFGYNDLQQLSSLVYSKASDFFSLTYGYGPSGANNGQIRSITDVLTPSKSLTYTYDDLGRLKESTGTNSHLLFEYDRYGNLTKQTDLIANTQLAPTIYPQTNHVGAESNYDTAGNMTSDGGWSFTYDGESRITQATGTQSLTYGYDPDGVRVKVTQGSSGTVYIFSGSKVIAEYAVGAAAASPTKEYVYVGNQLVTTLNGDRSIAAYHHPDHLSVRAETNTAGDTVTRTYGSLPFGGTWYETGTVSKWKFTSYERDATGLDYAMFRHYNNRLGRFMQVDPYNGSASVSTPQTWNRYAYVSNHPLDFIDSLGLGPCAPGTNCVEVIAPPPPDINLEASNFGWSLGAFGLLSGGNGSSIPKRSPEQVVETDSSGGGTDDGSVTPPATTPPPDPRCARGTATVNYQPRVPPASPEVDSLLDCTSSCMGVPLMVTSTSTISRIHPANTPHGRGEAADVRYIPGAGQRFMQCAGACGAEFALDEFLHPSAHATGAHFHVQLNPGRGGSHGDLPAHPTFTCPTN